MNTPSIRKPLTGLFATLLAIASLPLTSHAQEQGFRVQLKVPFGFSDGWQRFAPGTYVIGAENRYITLIRGGSASGQAMTQTVDDLQPARKGKVTFRRCGNQYFVQDVWSPGKTSHIHYVPSKAQRRAEIAFSGSGPDEVELALLDVPR